MEEELKQLRETLTKQEEEIKMLKESRVSQESIKAFVETLLNDKNVNIKYFPDSVEKQIYRNVINIIMEVVKHTIDSAGIKIMGHQITMKLNPDP